MPDTMHETTPGGQDLPEATAEIAEASAQPALSLPELRSRLEGTDGPTYWRSLEALADRPELQEFIKQEFPNGADLPPDTVGRRGFLKVMGASMALAGLGACVRQPEEKIIPYVKSPEGMVQGMPQYYATALVLDGYAHGVLARSDMGRPTKIEGNPDHPASLGGTNLWAQADILRMYDPDRCQTVTRRGVTSTWNEFLGQLSVQLETQRGKGGAGLRIVSEPTTSPTLMAEMARVAAEFPKAKWYVWNPAASSGTRAALGRDVSVRYDFSKARVILSLDSDFLCDSPGSVRYSRDFADGRRVRTTKDTMNRLYVADSTFSVTGSVADHRLALKPSEVDTIARAVAAALGVSGATAGTLAPDRARWVQAVAADLKSAGSGAVVVPGEYQPASVHALAHAMNAALGAFGSTVIASEGVEAKGANPDSLAGLKELCDEMMAGTVETLIVMGANPVYEAPGDVPFAKAMAKVPFRAHHGLYNDETALLCEWCVPASHALEQWHDARAYDGTVTIGQPLLAPLYDSKSSIEFAAILTGQTSVTGHDLVREYWKDKLEGDFERAWRRAIHNGVVGAPAASALAVTPSIPIPPPAPATTGMEVVFRPDPTIGCGAWANNGWLQELPKPLSKLTWDNAVHLSPATAEKFSVANNDIVELSVGSTKLQGPVWIIPGHPNDVVTLHLGYGRKAAGRVGNDTGFDVNPLRTVAAAWHRGGVSLTKTGETFDELVTTQDHGSLEGRNLYRTATLADFAKNAKVIGDMEHIPNPVSLYDRAPEMYDYSGQNKWGMSIDLNTCFGCGVCTIACQSENNIAVVGKDEVGRGREMHWLRIDRYFEGTPDAPTIAHQPIPCMHCESAPCEVVCPVAATVHGAEGLNEMVYNRCVGTKYCSNNCPYKVRRFNFYQYSDTSTPQYDMMRNPDVTVRNRGVMEKCNYCVQRVNVARIESKKSGTPIPDGSFTTACAQACPSQSIVFGNLNDPKSRVNAEKASPLNYGMLTELNTRPRTSYLGRMSNPNPALASAAPKTTGEHHG